jgi:hypothetical protein
VLGTITDAQESELLAVEELWPDVPHQVCQFHVLRDASKTAFEADKALKTAMRKRLQPKVREVRKQIKKYLVTVSPQEAEQLTVLDDYANGILTALNTDGLQPFKYATVEASQMLEEIEVSLQQLCKKGGRGVGCVRRSWHAFRALWQSGPPGQSQWHKSNACMAGSLKLSTCWTQAGPQREKC